MCLAIYKPAKLDVSMKDLETGFENNDHGAGFAYAKDGQVYIVKGFETFQEFYLAYCEHADRPMIIHFRLATHGHKNADNCHPFPVTDNLAMIHNGILNICTKSNPSRSDTWHYVNSVLRPVAEINPGIVFSPAYKFMGEQAIGSGNKFIFLRGDGAHSIWNEKSGHWSEGIWYSNTSYCYPFWYYDAKYRGAAKAQAGVLDTKDWSAFDDAAVDDTVVAEDEEDSRYYSQLGTEAKYCYEDLLAAGYDVEDIDSLIEHEGIEGLITTAEEHSDAI